MDEDEGYGGGRTWEEGVDDVCEIFCSGRREIKFIFRSYTNIKNIGIGTKLRTQPTIFDGVVKSINWLGLFQYINTIMHKHTYMNIYTVLLFSYLSFYLSF